MSIDIKSGLAYGYYLTAEQVAILMKSCSDFERDMLFDSWLIPLDENLRVSDALFAVPLRAVSPGTAAMIRKESIESGLAVQMMADFRKYCDNFTLENPEPQFYVYSSIT